MYRRTYTIATSRTDRHTEIADGASLPALEQRTWHGQVSDETVKKWLRSKGLKRARVSVHKNVDWRNFVDSSREVAA